jgi:hypothetical protein
MLGKGTCAAVCNGHTPAVLLLEIILAKEAKNQMFLQWKTPRLS